MSKNYPFSSTRQAERAKRQCMHNLPVAVNGKHNTIIQTAPLRHKPSK